MAKCGVCGKGVTFDIMQYYVPDLDGKKHRVCKSCAMKAQNEGKALKYDAKSNKLLIVERSDIEIRKKCNVCGHIFCYNPADLENNKKQARNAAFSAMSGIGGAMSGNYTTAAVQQGNVSNAINRIVDYNRCPNCGSGDLCVISKEEFQAELNANKQQFNSAAVSSADELKKFKELLDMGAITQEEFDAKKKQLLGL